MALAIEAIRPNSIPLPLHQREVSSPGFLERKSRITASDSHPNVAKSLDFENNSVYSIHELFDDEDSELIEEHEISRALRSHGFNDISGLNGISFPDGVRVKVKRKPDGKIVLFTTDFIEAQWAGGIPAKDKLEGFEEFRDILEKCPEILREMIVAKSPQYLDAIIEISPAEDTFVIFVSNTIRQPDPKVLQKSPFKVIIGHNSVTDSEVAKAA